MAAVSSWLLAAAIVASTGLAVKQQQDAKAAARQADRTQQANIAATEAAANQSKAAVVNNTGDVSLESPEALADAAVLARAKKNRLRVERTGASTGSATGLSI